MSTLRVTIMRRYQCIIPLVCSTLLSCSYGPVHCINKYSDYTSAYNDISKYDGSHFFIDLKQLEIFEGYEISYYLTGLCSHRPIHHEFNDICDDLTVYDGRIYAISPSCCVDYNVLANITQTDGECTIKPYDFTYKGELSYYFNSFRKKYDYNPTECADFNYLSITEDEEIGKQCFLILSKDNLVGNIIYSADASLDIIELINNEILSSLQKINE